VLAEGGRVLFDVVVALLCSQILDEACLEPLVSVEDEDGQDTADVGADELGAGEVEALRMPLLAEDDHIVPRAGPLPRERARVHVGARPAEEVAVPEQDPHERCLGRGVLARVAGRCGR
jgi:hypothetical protein